MSQSTINKSRNLSPDEYYINLQKEYIIADLRRQIYCKPTDQEYWKKVASHKKERIEKIATRSNLLSIFSDQRTYENIKFSIYGRIGMPSFIYRDETDYQNLRIKDIYGYFTRDTDARCELPELGTVLGKILYVDIQTELIAVSCLNVKYYLTYDKVARIF